MRYLILCQTVLLFLAEQGQRINDQEAQAKPREPAAATPPSGLIYADFHATGVRWSARRPVPCGRRGVCG